MLLLLSAWRHIRRGVRARVGSSKHFKSKFLINTFHSLRFPEELKRSNWTYTIAEASAIGTEERDSKRLFLHERSECGATGVSEIALQQHQLLNLPSYFRRTRKYLRLASQHISNVRPSQKSELPQCQDTITKIVSLHTSVNLPTSTHTKR